MAFLVMAVGGLSVAAAASREIPDGWFAWPAVEPANGSAIDVSGLNEDVAGESGRISVRDGQFVMPDGERVRFWGCNLSAAVAFPPVRELPVLARRLAKGGVNMARLHHLDNEWAVNSRGSLWPRNRKNHETVDPGQLDRLFRLVEALKAEGIYTNLNLKVSRSLVPADGFPPEVQDLPMFQKRVDIFDRRMIELQKAYARQLLTTRNPRTGLTLAEDPAVAVIEMNNENSLLGFWTRDLGRNLDRLPQPWRENLTSSWNTWLARRYANDTALREAWAPETAEVVSILPDKVVWLPKKTAGAEFSVLPGATPTAFAIDVNRVTGIDWHAQLQLPGFVVKDGQTYTVAFAARAARPREVAVGVGLDNQAHPEEPWRSFGLLDRAPIGTGWTQVRFAFTAHSSGGAPAVLQLNLGQQPGRVEIRDFTLAQGAEGTGLRPNQSASSGTVPIPLVASAAQWADWIHFLADTERAYAEEMRRFLREELGVQAPMVCSQIEYGGLTAVWREQSMEFVDTHAYWQHPVLENGDFSSPNWTIENSPQVAVMGPRGFGELGDRALLRLAGKPFAMSEYDHAAPTEFASEMYPTLATFGCRQDWDAIYPFDIGPSGSRNRHGTIGRFFDQLNHPAKWGFSPLAALVFRQGLVSPAPAQRTIAVGGENTLPWTPHVHADLAWKAQLGEQPVDFLNTRYAIATGAETTSTAATRKTARAADSAEGAGQVRLLAGELGQVYAFHAAQVSGLVGYLGGDVLETEALRVSCERFGRDFAAVSAVALDDRPLRESQRILVTIVGRAQNQGIVWNEDRTSVGASWGHGPAIVEHVPATITLLGAGDAATDGGAQVYALAPNGTRSRRIEASASNGGLTFAVDAKDKTIHYEIVRIE